jgi:hypothetical protein
VTTIVVVASVVLLLVALAYVLFGRSPEQTASHEQAPLPDDSSSSRFYAGTDAPAGPDAEEQRP